MFGVCPRFLTGWDEAHNCRAVLLSVLLLTGTLAQVTVAATAVTASPSVPSDYESSNSDLSIVDHSDRAGSGIDNSLGGRGEAISPQSKNESNLTDRDNVTNQTRDETEASQTPDSNGTTETGAQDDTDQTGSLNGTNQTQVQNGTTGSVDQNVTDAPQAPTNATEPPAANGTNRTQGQNGTNQTGTKNGTSQPAQPSSVIVERGSSDPDGNGRYEDVNGDGKLTIADSQALYANLDHSSVRTNASRYDFTQDGRTDVGDVRWLFRVALGLETADSDGDGLSDSYERNVTRTDPFDFNSNSSVTSADESQNGVIDGMEDFDDDGVVTFREAALETDPFENDTDGDGLTDREEFRGGMGAVSPTDTDTDDDGVPDGEDDADGDTLSNEREVELDSHPGRPDTDADRLDDSAELDHGTNLTDPDTDDDGFLDGEEIEFGFDPTSADSDGDGVPDTEEEYTATVDGEGASVEITSSGHFRENTTVERDRGHVVAEENPAVVGPFVDIETDAEIESASVTVEYDESAVTNESNVTVARFNTSVGTFETVDSTVDTANDTVTGSVEHFSTFTALDQDEWKEDLDRIVPTGVQNSTDAQVLAYLRQGYNNAYGTITLHDASLDESVSTLDGGDGVDTYGNGVPAVGSTSHPNGCADDEVHRLNDTRLDFNLETCGSDDAFTINYNVVGENPRLVVEYRRTNTGLVINGSVFPSDTTVNLTEDGVNITDTDKDGIVDSIENQPIPLGNGLTVDTDPYDADTDGDGLKDGTELLLAQKNAAGYDAQSDPGDPDTDGDGLNDYDEVVVHDGLEPWDEDTDDDGIADGEDSQPLTPDGRETVEEGSYTNSAGQIVGDAAWGAVLGEAGIEWTGAVSTVVNNAPVTDAEFHESNTKTFPYFAGWLGVAIAPGVDVFADVRDCAVVNTGGLWETIGANGLDCGGAAISVVSKVGQGGGALLAIPSGGLSLSITGGSFAVDVGEDVLTDVGPITARAIDNSPRLVDDIGRYIVLRLDTSVARLSDAILPRLSDDLANRLRQVMDRTKTYDDLLTANGVSRQQAKLLAPMIHRSAMTADEAADVVRRVDNLGELSGAQQSLIVRRLAGSDDLARLTDTFDAETLAAMSRHADGVSRAGRMLDRGIDANRIQSLARNGGLRAVPAGAFDELAVNLDDVRHVSMPDGMRFAGERYGVATDVRYYDDGGQFLRRFDAAALSKGAAGERLADAQMRARIGSKMDEGENIDDYVLKGFDGNVNLPGPDLVYRDPDSGDVVVEEVKTLGKTGNFGVGDMGTTNNDNIYQMSDQWISNIYQNQRGVSSETASELLAADNAENLRKEVTFVRNADRSGKTIARSLNSEEYIQVDAVRILNIGDQI